MITVENYHNLIPPLDQCQRLVSDIDGKRILELIDSMHQWVAEWDRLPQRHWEWTRQEPISDYDRVAYWWEKLAYENIQIWHYADDYGQAIAHNRLRCEAIRSLDSLLSKGTSVAETIGVVLDRANFVRMFLYYTLVLNAGTLKYLARIQSLIDEYSNLRYRAASIVDTLRGVA